MHGPMNVKKNDSSCSLFPQTSLPPVLQLTSDLDRFVPVNRGNAVDIALPIGWTVRGSNPGRGRIFSLLQNRPDRLWGTPRLLFHANRGYFPMKKGQGVKWTISI